MKVTSNNDLIIDNLEQLVAHYEEVGDTYRARAYEKAIQTICDLDDELKSGEQAVKLPNIGKSIAAKIDEILANGTLDFQTITNTKSNITVVPEGDELNAQATVQTDALQDDVKVLQHKRKRKAKNCSQVSVVKITETDSDNEPDNASANTKYQKTDYDRTMKMLSKVWGAGPVACKTWYKVGVRTLQDLQKPNIRMNTQQRLGLKYYHEFDKRIPRPEVAKIGACVKKVLSTFDPKMNMQICGSFRRGHLDSGDIDVLICKPGVNQPSKCKGILPKFVAELLKYKILTDHLSLGNDKYMGVCKVSNIHRRIDIKIIPHRQWHFALLYFTGSAAFNKRMRLIAKKKKLKLNEKGLYELATNKRFHAESEKQIFEMLSMKYLEPNERKY